MVAALPGLLLFQAVPGSAATMRSPALFHGAPDTPDQLTGSAAGFPSLVETKRTSTTVQATSLPAEVDPPKQALPPEGRFVKEPQPSATTAPLPSKKQRKRAKSPARTSAAMLAAAPCGSVSPWRSNFAVAKGERVASAGRIWEALQAISGIANTTPPENSFAFVWADRGACPLPPAPTVTSMAPADEALVMTLQPTLSATVTSWPGGVAGFDFEVCDSPSMSGECVRSDDYDDVCCGLSGQWTVPEGLLAWGKEYWWQVYVTDASTIGGQGAYSATRSFTMGVRQPTITSNLSARGIDGQEFHQSSGNYTTAFTDATLPTAGPPLSVVRSYNSMDPRRDGAFGAGWSTRFDMRIVPETIRGFEALLVTYPDGRTVRFADKKDGTFQPPPGTYATLATVTGGGWRLMDKSSTSYLFDAQGRLLKATDGRGRSQELTYGTDGKLSKVTAAGDRSLSFTWTGAHVTAVSTDPVNGAPLTWTYAYTGDRLTRVCAPTTDCTDFEYGAGSLYRSSIQDADPFGYWRLSDASGSAADLGWGAGPASYSGETRGRLGALAGSTDTAVDLTSSGYVELPAGLMPRIHQQGAVELWFKSTGTGRILSSGQWGTLDPLVQVGADGKLRASLRPTASPIVSPAAVNDGAWHHLAFTLNGDTQTLYLDGLPVGALTQPVDDEVRDTTRIGGGLAGSVDELAVYDRPLTAAEVAAHFAARLEAPNKLTKITLPSGRVWATNTYDPATERLKTHANANGGTWQIGALAYDRTTGKSTVTVTDPLNETLKYVYDAWRGYRLVSRTDQLLKVTTYTYDTGGFLSTVTDPNLTVTERFHDKRGNLLGTKQCRTTNSCQTDHHEYYLNKDNQFDPRNDQPVASRDARSSSATDNTYATKWEYNQHGEKLKETTPATPDFPTGRSTTFTYTDGTEPAVGGGTAPAGLVKSEKDAKDNETTYRYTSAGDLAEETSVTGVKTQFAYDSLGREVSQTEVSQAHPAGVTSTFTYDGVGRLLTQTDPGVKNEVTNVTHTAKTTYTYDADGNPLTETLTDLTGGDPARTTTYTYDAKGRLETMTGPEGGVARSTWDITGAKASATDPLGTVFTYAYTKRGELTSKTIKNWTGSPVSPQAPQDVVLESYSYDPGGRLAGQADAMGRKTSYTYFNDNRLSQTAADDVRLNGSTTTADVVLEDNTYDAVGNLIKQVSGGGAETADYVYDAASRITSTTFDPATLKRKIAYEYDANDNVTKENLTGAGSARVESTLYTYNALGLVTRQSVENGDDDLVSTNTFDDRGLLTAATTPRGNASGATAADFTTTMRYDLLGQLVETKAPQVKIDKAGVAVDGRPTVKYGYDNAGLVTHSVDPEGRTIVSAFDKAGRLVSDTASSYTPPGATALTPKISYDYDAGGQVTKVTDQRGYVTSTEYDALGRPVRVTDPGPSGPGGIWVAEFTMLGEVRATIDPTGARTEATYDDMGRQITWTQIERKPSTAALTTKLTYDNAGNLTKSLAPGDKSTDYTFNAVGQVKTVTDPLLHKSLVDYDFLGRTSKVTDALGNATAVEYDVAGRKIAAKDLNDAGAVTRTFGFGYDLDGNPTTTTSGESRITRRTFDALGQMTSLIEPVSATRSITSTFGYDATGAPTRTTDGRGNATWTGYNTLGLVESVIEASTAAHPNAADRTWTSVYDVAGNPVAIMQPGGVRIDRTFDHLGRVATETGTGASVSTPSRTYAYDQVDRPTAIGDYALEYNDRSLLTKVSKAANQVATYAYDSAGNPTQRVDPAGTATYTWDAADRLKTASDPVTGRTWTYGYDNADRLTSKTSANPVGTQTYGYDTMDRLTSQAVKNSSGTELSKITYGWDKDDNLTTKTTTGTAGAGVNTYGYDHAGRLTSWIAPGGATTDYTWDDSGNRTTVGAKTFTYDERNRLVSGAGTDYTYTSRGTTATETKNGVTRNLTFDAFDRLISDGDASYGYDALGRMTSRTKGADQRRFVYSGLENDIVTVADGANTTLAKYGRDPFGGLLSLQEGASPALATMTDLHDDVVATFSGTALVDSVAYDPFGEVTHRSGTPRSLGYQGEYTDPDTGKVNMHARWYQPGTGAFTSRDDWTLDPQPSVQANRYTYGNANPLANTDPSGHGPIKWSDAGGGPPPVATGGRGGPGGGSNSGGAVMSVPQQRQAPPKTAPTPAKAPPAKAAPTAPKTGTKSASSPKNGKRVTTPARPAGSTRPQMVPTPQGSASDPKYGYTTPSGQKNNNKKDKGKPCTKCNTPKNPPTPPKNPPTPPKKTSNPPKKKVKIAAKKTTVTIVKPKKKEPVNQCAYGPCEKSHAGHVGIELIGSPTTGGGGGVSCEEWNPGNCGEDRCGKYVGFVYSTSVFGCVPGSDKDIGNGTARPQNFPVPDNGSDSYPETPPAPPAFCQSGNSFVPGTKILMANGTTKPIEEVEVGDWVVAADAKTGATAAKRVSHLITGDGEKHLVRLTITADATTGKPGTVVATDGHPFWVPDLRKWVTAGELLPGMLLRTSAGTYVQLTAIKKWTATQRVHNLTIDGLHTYHVIAGDQAILVHNDGWNPFKKKGAPAPPSRPDPNATIRDLLKYGRPDADGSGDSLDKLTKASKMQDWQLLDSIFEPHDGEVGYIRVGPDGRNLENGNHRARELLNRAADPHDDDWDYDTEIYIDGHKGC
ncbi:polymorphic toxin-type HINT domain-containing protein [Streptosporangium sp. NBC_01495]|uniref:LamG-like jellyroll fold domain-containing protein n=1 Tax=Streptosporangium sp. NBC_01495 TaxID=2903899 RepID=UPI002E32581E|nr:LamG-like jellyroll fold domain-containing protein [Streptosporangium sp. NBC_01495]